MSKLVILEISNADSEQRYPVTLRIGDSIHSINSQISGYLPPAKDLRETYHNLQKARDSRGFGSYRKFEQMKKGKVTKVSVKKSADCVKNSVNNWLSSKDECFYSVQEQLLEVLITERGNVRLMIQTDDVYLWRLPWHLWNKFERFKIEPLFSRLLLTNTTSNLKKNNPKNKIKILVILGDSTDIDIQGDLVLLKESIAHNDAEIETLVATSSSKLNNQLWEQNWDILFFAGHSSTEDGYRQGQLALSETESIAIEQLKYGLENAIKHGLKLAIFNSCDGMGLVNELASLQIPAVIAMRERVPDEVAQKFLEYFLEAFAREKKSLPDSVRKARERLHGMEVEYPCASWLPMIYEHPAVESPSWDELLKGNEEERQRVSIWRNLQTVLVASVLVTSACHGSAMDGIVRTFRTSCLRSFNAAAPT